jgi:hypothetical protein
MLSVAGLIAIAKKVFENRKFFFTYCTYKNPSKKNSLLFFGTTVYLEVDMKVHTTVVIMKVQLIVVKMFVLYPREESGLLMSSLCKEINALYGGSGCGG